MKIKMNAEGVETDDPYYSLFESGYIKPAKLLEKAFDAEKVEYAIATIKEFLSSAEAAGKLNKKE